MNLPHVFLGTLREHYILLFGAAGGFALVFGFIGAWFGSRFGARTVLHRTVTDATQTLASRAEVAAVTEELQALLLEVERVAEAERFVAKLLTERSERVVMPPIITPARREPGEITPH
jgi:hypothetical protein